MGYENEPLKEFESGRVRCHVRVVSYGDSGPGYSLTFFREHRPSRRHQKRTLYTFADFDLEHLNYVMNIAYTWMGDNPLPGQ